MLSTEVCCHFQVDAAALQYQNQRLIQLLEAQKRETHALEKKFTELKDKHDSYDEILISVNSLWNRVFMKLHSFNIEMLYFSSFL